MQEAKKRLEIVWQQLTESIEAESCIENGNDIIEEFLESLEDYPDHEIALRFASFLQEQTENERLVNNLIS
jgi:hypothetical protein